MVQKMAGFATRLGEAEAIIDKLVIFVMSGQMVQEHWAHHTSDAMPATTQSTKFEMPRYDNAQVHAMLDGIWCMPCWMGYRMPFIDSLLGSKCPFLLPSFLYSFILFFSVLGLSFGPGWPC